MKLVEDQLLDKVVFVNGKRIAADIKELNTDQGWVDIMLPVINSPVVISARNKSLNGDLGKPKDSYIIKRLEGKVEVFSDQNSARNNRLPKKT